MANINLILALGSLDIYLLDDLVKMYLKLDKWCWELKVFVEDMKLFHVLLQYIHMVVGGSVALHFVLIGMPHQAWIPGDLDVYAPSTSISTVIDYLCHREG